MKFETKYLRLGDICEVVRGGSPRPIIDYITDDPDGVNWLKIGDVKETDKYFTHANERIKRSGISKTREVRAGDLILSNSMSFGRAFITLIDGYIHDGWLRLRCDERIISKEYLYYFLISSEAQNQFKAVATGSVVNNLKADTVRETKIAVPSLAIQEKIVAILRSIDEKIVINEQINDNLEQQTQTIYRERFEGVSPDNLPFDWRIVTLGEVATISNKSFNPLKEAERLLEHYSIPAFDEARFPVFEPSTSIKSNKFIIDASCFMISKLNPTTKRVWKPYCITENAVCSTEFIVYKAKDQAITDFLYSVIDSSSFTDFMCSHVTGSTGSRQRTTPSDTLTYELVLPSDDELAEFQSVVSPMYAQMRINAIENDRLKRLRDSLLPKLMSGEIDVSGIQL